MCDPCVFLSKRSLPSCLPPHPLHTLSPNPKKQKPSCSPVPGSQTAGGDPVSVIISQTQLSPPRVRQTRPRALRHERRYPNITPRGRCCKSTDGAVAGTPDAVRFISWISPQTLTLHCLLPANEKVEDINGCPRSQSQMVSVQFYSSSVLFSNIFLTL